MRSKILTLLSLSGLIWLTGCHAGGNQVTPIHQNQNATSNSNPQAAQTAHADGARRITTHELNDLIKKNEVFIVDVRNLASFNAGHIPGAKLIPHSEILNHIDEMPKNKLIVTYCS